MKLANACEYDSIPYRFLIDSLPMAAFFFLIITNASIVTGVFYELWIHPHVVPTFKSGDSDIINSFRPTSLYLFYKKEY